MRVAISFVNGVEGRMPNLTHRQITRYQFVQHLTTAFYTERCIHIKTFTKLAKEGKIGRLCQLGAWIVAALGTLQILLQLYTTWEMYQQTQLSQPGSPYSDVSFFLNNVSFAFGSVINTIFSFLVLYAAGTIINTIFFHENSDITFEPLKEEEVAQRNDHC